MSLGSLLENYALVRMRHNALYSMVKDCRAQMESYESQIQEKLRLEPLPKNELKNLVERLSK